MKLLRSGFGRRLHDSCRAERRVSLGTVGRQLGALPQVLALGLHLLPLPVPDFADVGLLSRQLVQNVVEAVSGLAAVVLETLDAEILDGGSQPVKPGFDPGLLDGDGLLVRIFGVCDVLDFLDGGHEPAEADVAGVRHDLAAVPVDEAFFDEWNHPLEVDQEILAPLRDLVGLGEEPPGVEDPVGAELSIEGVLGQHMGGKRVRVTHEDALKGKNK